MHIIDIENWNRRVIYKNFIGYDNPIFSISTRLDVTALREYCTEHDKKFFITLLFVVTKCLNEVDEFRLRLRRGEVVQYDAIKPSFIVNADGAIATCRTDFVRSYKEFYDLAINAQKVAESSAHTTFNEEDDNDLFYISCMPWVDIHSFSNPYDLKNADISSIPRIMWSRFVPENDRLKMTLDISAHHALIDGEPVCRALNKIQNAIDGIEEFLNKD